MLENKKYMLFEQIQEESTRNLEPITSSFQQLTRDKAIEKFKTIYKKDPLPYYVQPKDYFYHNPESKINFDIEIQDKALLDSPILIEFFEVYKIDPIKIFLDTLTISKKRYNTICEKLNIEVPEEELLRIKLSSQKAFTTPIGGADQIGMGIQHIEILLKAILEKDEEKISDTKALIESQYFHEFIHQICDEDFLDNDTIEELTLLGEFLYNPKDNKMRNHEVFNALSEQIFNEENLKENNKWGVYHKAYKTVTSKILLNELMERGYITPPISEQTIQSILSNIDKPFSEMTENERDEILIKYLPMKKDELIKLGISVSEKFGLSI